MKNLKIALLIAVLALTGCAKLGLRDHSKDYAYATRTNEIKMPSKVGLELGQDYYPAPTNVHPTAADDKVSLIPPGSPIQCLKAQKKNKHKDLHCLDKA